MPRREEERKSDFKVLHKVREESFRDPSRWNTVKFSAIYSFVVFFCFCFFFFFFFGFEA